MIGRREFMGLLGGAAAWPLAARAQEAAIPVVGLLSSVSAEVSAPLVTAFRRGLNEAGYVDGQNLAIEYRWAQDQYDRLPALAAELVRHPVRVIVAAGGPVSALAAKAETATIPIVFTAVSDPVKSGLVASLNRPGGNVTGVAALTIELDAKRLELLRELVPSAAVIGALVNPNRPGVDAQLKDIGAAAQRFGRQLVVLRAGTERELDTVFAAVLERRIGAILIGADPFFNSRRQQLLGLVSRYAVPAIDQWREFAMAGGLLSYGPNLSDAYRHAGIYTGRILKGTQPADLPVMQPTKFEFVINLKTAKTLGLEVPATLLARADEVIE